MSEALDDLNKKFPGGLAKTSFKDTDYPDGNVYWLRFDGAQCPICGKTDWCCVNVTGTKVICMRVDNGKGKKIGNGFLYELKDGKKVNFDPNKVERRNTVPYQNASAMDLMYRMVLIGSPLTEKHRENLRKRGLSDEQIDSHQYRGFGSYYTAFKSAKKYHASLMHDTRLGLDKDGNGTVVSNWNETLKKLNLPEDFWQGVPGFYQKKVKVESPFEINSNDHGRVKVPAGTYKFPAFSGNAEGMLVPYYNEFNQLVGFQIRVDQVKTWASVLKAPKGTKARVKFDDGSKHYQVFITRKNSIHEEMAAEGELDNDHDEVTVHFDDLGNRIVFKPHVGGKYFWVSSSRKDLGAEGKTPIQVSYNPTIAKLKPTDSKLNEYIEKPKSVWLTEGGLKAIVATNNLEKNFSDDQLDKYGRDFLAVAGVSSYRKFLPMLKKLNVDRVTVAFDMDFMKKSQVSESLTSLINLLREKGYRVTVAFWKNGKGIDDALVNGSEIRFKDL